MTRGDARTEVTLVNGKVDVTRGDVSEILTPNSQFVVDNESGKCRTRAVNVSTYVDWKNGLLNFDAMPLEELGDEIGASVLGVKFFFSKESLKHFEIFRSFGRKYDNIDYILALIEATTNVLILKLMEM